MTDMNAGEKPAAAFSLLKHTGQAQVSSSYRKSSHPKPLHCEEGETGEVHTMLRIEKVSKATFKALHKLKKKGALKSALVFLPLKVYTMIWK